MLPIDFTDDGIWIFSKDLHPLKTQFPKETTDSGIEILHNEEQLQKALFSRDVTVDGMTISVKFIHPFKTESPNCIPL